MNIKAVVNILNKELSAGVSCEYYERIEEWRQWWAGYVKTFHRVHETTDTGRRKARDLYSLRMAKKVCEDWAAYLLNEKTRILVDDKASAEFLTGPENEQETGGALGDIDFWGEGNALVEKAFYSGTGAFVLRMEGLAVGEDGGVLTSSEAKIRMAYLPAQCIIPLTVKYGRVTEAAFVSEGAVKGKTRVYLETHTLEAGVYVIHNRYYEQTGGGLKPLPLPAGMAERLNTGSEIPFFALIRPAMVNPYEDSMGLGCAVFSQAVDNLKGADIAYNNFVRDLWLGGKKVFYNREMTKTIGLDEKGNPIYLAPDDMLQQLFVSFGEERADGKALVQEFNPALRVQDNRDAVQAMMDYLSFKCGMGARHYRFDAASGPVTATQYTGEKQELKQYAAKHGTIIGRAIADIARAMLWAGRYIMGQNVDPDAGIRVEFSDGYIVSDEEKKEADRLDVAAGILNIWEYRMRWFGEDEKTAKQNVPASGVMDIDGILNKAARGGGDA